MSRSEKSISGRSIIIEEIPKHVKELQREVSRILFSYFFHYQNNPDWNPKIDLATFKKTEHIKHVDWEYHKNPKNHAHLLAYHGSVFARGYIEVIIGKKSIEEQNLAIALLPENRITALNPRELDSETSSSRERKPPRKKQSIENSKTLNELERAKQTNTQLASLVNKYVDEGLTLKDRAIEEVRYRDTGIKQLSQANAEQKRLIQTLENRNLHVENQFSKTLHEANVEIAKKRDEIHELSQILKVSDSEISKQAIELKHLRDQLNAVNIQIQTDQEKIKTLENTNFSLQSQVITQQEYLDKESIETQDQFKSLQEQNAERQKQLLIDIKQNYDAQFDKQLEEKVQEFKRTEDKFKSQLQQAYSRETELLQKTIADSQIVLQQKDQQIRDLQTEINNLKQIHQQEMTTRTMTESRTNNYETMTLREENSELRAELDQARNQMGKIEVMMQKLLQRQEFQQNPSRHRESQRDHYRGPPDPRNRGQNNPPPGGDPEDDDPDDFDDDAGSQRNNRRDDPFRPRREFPPQDLLPNENAAAKETIDIVPTFTGDTAEGAVNISEWISKVDRARHWTKPCQHGLLLEKILTMKVKGRAQSCISNVEISTYDQLKDVLVKRVNPMKSSLLLMNEMTACIHTHGTIQEHNIRFRKIYTSWLNAKRLELKQAHQTDEAITIYLQISDKDVIQTYLQNLKEDTRAYLRTKDIYSLALAETTAQEHEDFKRSIQRQRGMFHDSCHQQKPDKSKSSREQSRTDNKHEKRSFFSMNKPNVHHTKRASSDEEDEEQPMTEEEKQYQTDILRFNFDSINTVDEIREALEYVTVMNHPDRQCNYCNRTGHTEMYCNQKKKDKGIPSPFNKKHAQKKNKNAQKENQNFRKNQNQKRPPQQKVNEQKVNVTNEERENTSDDERSCDESASQQ